MGGRRTHPARRGPVSSKKRARLAKRRIAGVPLKIAIVTDPASTGSSVDLSRDVELVKASVLYADEVELVSLGAVMLASIVQMAEGGPESMLSLFTSIDDETLRHFGQDDAELPANWRQLVAQVSDPAFAHMPGMAEIGDQMRDGLAEPMRMVAELAEQQITDSGAAELIPAINSGPASVVGGVHRTVRGHRRRDRELDAGRQGAASRHEDTPPSRPTGRLASQRHDQRGRCHPAWPCPQTCGRGRRGHRLRRATSGLPRGTTRRAA